ncbi:Uncharacterised protein [Klebsiella pneumoniae]|nr:Uncharacterised protein [Klebsiella pneumoniae]
MATIVVLAPVASFIFPTSKESETVRLLLACSIVLGSLLNS